MQLGKQNSHRLVSDYSALFQTAPAQAGQVVDFAGASTELLEKSLSLLYFEALWDAVGST